MPLIMMSRETKLNLIVLAVVIALLTPGAVILVKKRMKPMVRAPWEPDPVRKTVAYMVPGEVPPGMERVNPSRVAAWVQSLMQSHGLKTSVPHDEDGMPLMSDGRSFQLIGTETADSATRVVVLTWLDAGKHPSAAWSLVIEGKSVEPKQVQHELIEVPDLVRQELGEDGLLAPPHRVQWDQLMFTQEVKKSAVLVREEKNGAQDKLVFVTSVTSPAKSMH